MLLVCFWLFRLLLLVVVLLSFTSLSCAYQVTFAWDANSESYLAGYKLYWGDESRQYTESIDVGNVTEYILEISNRTYIAATAYSDHDPSLESGYSNEVYFVVVEEIFPASNGQLFYEVIIVLPDDWIDTLDDEYIDTLIDEWDQ